MLSKINTAVCSGMEGGPVMVETDIASGLPSVSIVGLAATMVQEAKERIRTAIVNSDFKFPRGRITINLRPANLRKNSSCLDLPIAVCILASAMFVDSSKARGYGMIGELSLDGSVVGVNGVMPIVQSMLAIGIRRIIVPYSNYGEASLIEGCKIIPVQTLEECVGIINGTIDPDSTPPGAALKLSRFSSSRQLDFGDIRGQENAKRAVVVAVTGRHGLLMVGSPGCGKTMIARRIPTIMPPMTSGELIETAIVNSVAGNNNREGSIPVDRPFRSPHSTIGRAGLLGGGAVPIPGEITLAHNGVLFLDEVCEFEREIIEALRVPVEEKKITHFRKGISYTFPCNFQMVMAANPCKCGYYGDPDRMCRCSPAQLEQYRKKLSGPMMDRIDMRINMEKVSYEQISGDASRITSEDMRNDVTRGISFARSRGRKGSNALMTDKEVGRFCRLGREEAEFMTVAYNSMNLSPRSYNRILKVARTVADLDESDDIRVQHLAEAMSYRMVEVINEG